MSTRVPEPLGPAEYARQVRAALGDLPAASLEELLEDLDEHLGEVAAEGSGPLEAQLGPPAVYAQELRRAAGLPAWAGTARAPRGAELRDAAARLARRPEVRSVLAFLPELRPAWWVARAWLALLAVGFLFGYSSGLFPFGPVLGLPLLAGAVVLSVRLGRRAQRGRHPDPRRRLVTVGVNAVLAVLAVVALGVGQQRSSQPVYADGPSPSPAYRYGDGGTLAHEDGSPVTNIYPYSSAGQPLTGVLLYDQDGRALDNLSPTTREGLPVERVVPPGSPPPPGNAYPQRQRVQVYDEHGVSTLAPEDPRTSPTAPPSPAVPSPGTQDGPVDTPSPSPSATSDGAPR